MLEERDRLIAFAIQQRKKNEELFRQEEEIQNRVEILQQHEALLAKQSFEYPLADVRAYEILEHENAALKKQVLLLIEAEKKRDALMVDIKEYETLKHENAALNTQIRLLIKARKRTEEKSRDTLIPVNEALIPVNETLDAAIERNRELSETSAILTRKCSALESVAKELNHKIGRLEKQRETLKQEIQDQDDHQEILVTKNIDLSNKVAFYQNQVEQLNVESATLRSQCQQFANYLTNSAFAINDLDLVLALSSHVVEQFDPPTKIVTIGEGPYDEYEFNDYLRRLSIQPYKGDSAWIIVGREGWTEEQIDELIEHSDLDEIRVFSQELFVAGILTTHDPFSLPIEMLKKFAEGHPALEYLMDSGFEWPEINPEEDYGDPSFHMGFAGGVDESPLTAIGYHVGVTRGLDEKDRRKLLEMAFKQKIPAVGDEAYMKEWGRPNHSKRLWRIAHHIKREAEKRKSIFSMRHACRHWKSDSEWLKNQFYTNRMRFQWPDV